jgi:3-hydroxybutyryl-CoA dehydratase
MIGKTIDQIQVGDKSQFSKTVSESDIYLFAGISGDMNPAHINEAYAAQTHFKTRIAHGMLSAGFISTILGCQLPGPGTIYLSQELKFLAPVRIGDTITAQAEVIEIAHDKHQVTLATVCWNQNDKKVIKGTAVVSPPRAIK